MPVPLIRMFNSVLKTRLIMIRKFQLTAVLLLFVSLVSLVAQKNSSYTELDKVLDGKSIRIVITDSGVGGLSVMSDIATKLKESGSFRKVELIFANALFDSESGYNAMQLREDKIDTFNRVLCGINTKYDPDLIFVACNTLSVLINDTDFVRHKKNPPVIGIIDTGINLISERLQKNQNSSVIIFGTETTIEEGTHKRALLNMGFDKGRVINMACPQLQSYIELNPSGEETEMLITYYLSEAVDKIKDTDQLVDISLNCTHFGYSSRLWEEALNNSVNNPGEVLDPNKMMGNILISESNRQRFNTTEISFTIVSKVSLANVEAMIKIFESSSPEMAEALRNYKLVKDLF